MRNQLTILFLSLITFSCAERFEFEEENTPITVIDAKVSTNPEETRIIAYLVDGEENRIHQSGYQFTIRSGSGDTFQFTESNSVDGVIYTNTGFAGVEGEYYIIEGVTPEGFLISAADSILPSLPFDLDIPDTTFLQQSMGNEIVELDGYSVNVTLNPAGRESLFAKFRFEYSYVDYFTGVEFTVKTNDGFTLINCEGDCTSYTRSLDLVADREWLFVTDPLECNEPFPPPETSTCAKYFLDYETIFKIRGEYMSKENYRYWREVEKLLNNDGLVFDVFPFPVQGNISCDGCEEIVIGHFQAVSEARQEEIIYL